MRATDSPEPPVAAPPASDRWLLAGDPRVLEFPFSEGAQVTLRAFAALGGSARIHADKGMPARVSASAVAAMEPSSAALNLQPAASPFHFEPSGECKSVSFSSP